MTDLKRLADLVRGCDMLDADRDYLATLLRSAAGETVGTEWDHADTMSAPYPQRACVRHNADLSACRLALVAARKERDEALQVAYMIRPVDDRNPAVDTQSPKSRLALLLDAVKSECVKMADYGSAAEALMLVEKIRKETR